MNDVILDASVVTKCLVTETDSDLAIALSMQDLNRLAPDFLLIECANATWKKVRRKQLNQLQANQILTALNLLPITLVPSRHIVGAAMVVAMELDRSVYDSLYIALAMAKKSYVITADRNLYNSVSRSALRSYVRYLGDYRNN